MSAAEEIPEQPVKSRKKKVLIIAPVLFALGAGGGFGAIKMGLFDSILGSDAAESEVGAMVATGQSSPFTASGTPSFVDIPTVVVNLPRNSGHRHLRFTMKLEVQPNAVADIVALEPRILDILNTYLRAVDAADFDQPQTLSMIRAHLLARMQIVAGSGRVTDVLVQEFVLN